MTEYLEMQHDQPYGLAICAAQGRLDYLGVAHTLDANSEAVQLIRAQYQREPPDIVYVEGPTFEPKASLEDSVRAYGEAGALHVVMQEPALVSRLGCAAGASTGRSPSVHRCHASCTFSAGK